MLRRCSTDKTPLQFLSKKKLRQGCWSSELLDDEKVKFFYSRRLALCDIADFSLSLKVVICSVVLAIMYLNAFDDDEMVFEQRSEEGKLKRLRDMCSAILQLEAGFLDWYLGRD
eukprot:s1327_g20.t1